MLAEKANAVCLLKILTEYSDEKHILPMREIIARMKQDYDVAPDRRTIYSSITVLINLGYEISAYEDNGIGYYLKQRLFEPGEVRLLMDAVCSFSCLSQKHTEELIKKLQWPLSINERKRINHFAIAKPKSKTKNRQMFWNIEQLDEAISSKVKVKFTYLQYNLNKELVPRRKECYTVNPYGMMFHNEKYYLVCVKDNKDTVSMYRIDRIQDIEITNDALDPQEPGFDPQKSTEQAIYAYSGEPEQIVIHCKRSILDHVIDKYGTDILIHERDHETLEIRFTVSPNGVKFWALQYLPSVEVISPQWLRDEIIESINASSYFELSAQKEAINA